VSEPEVVVVGGGPAGLSAAATAAAAGARVALFDEGRRPGGQLRYRLAPVRARPGLPLESAAAAADRLTEEAITAGVVISSNAPVWAAFEDGSLGVSDDGGSRLVRPAVVVLATGATDLPLPFAGGSLPGVFSARAVLIALNAWRVRPGRRWALVGTGPERDEVAAAIALAGGEVVVIADPAGGDVIAAEGAAGVTAIVVNGRRRELDCVVVTAGRQPDAALALMAGCAFAAGAAAANLVPVVDAFGRSTDPRIVLAGDTAGVCQPEVALAEGRLAGLAAAAAVGRAIDDDLEGALDRERSLLAERQASRLGLAATYVQPYR